jgi:hypothetical protein
MKAYSRDERQAAKFQGAGRVPLEGFRPKPVSRKMVYFCSCQMRTNHAL